MSQFGNELLLEALKPLEAYYDQDGVEEIAINRPNEVYIKPVGRHWEPVEAPEVTFKYINALCRQLANITEQGFDRDRIPILSATLPGGHRFQAVVGTNVRYDISHTQGMALCIRRFSGDKHFSLSDYMLNPGEKLETEIDYESETREKYSEFAYEDLIRSVEKGEAVLISGATSTGKTTFLNALVEYIPRDRRIITVEDTREVMLPHDNRVHLVVSRTAGSNEVGYSHILDAVVRMTPDVIICGEISITNAKSIYRLMTTGHANFMATIHAESPQMALRAFWQNLTQNDANLDANAAIDIISRSFGRIVQIDRSSGQRVVTSVDIPKMMHEMVKSEPSGPASPPPLSL